MKNSNILTVVSVSEIKKDKNKREYVTIKVQTPDTKEVGIAGGGTAIAKIQPKIGTINSYGKSYLNNQKEFGFDLKEGDIILGDIVTQKVEPYEIPNKKTGEVYTVNTYSCVVLGDSASSSWDASVSKAFTSNEKIIDLNLVDKQEVPTPVYTEEG